MKVIAKELLKIAKSLLSFEFDTEDELKKYLREHPEADKRNHWIKEKKPAVKHEQKDTKVKLDDLKGQDGIVLTDSGQGLVDAIKEVIEERKAKSPGIFKKAEAAIVLANNIKGYDELKKAILEAAEGVLKKDQERLIKGFFGAKGIVGSILEELMNKYENHKKMDDFFGDILEALVQFNKLKKQNTK